MLVWKQSRSLALLRGGWFWFDAVCGFMFDLLLWVLYCFGLVCTRLFGLLLRCFWCGDWFVTVFLLAKVGCTVDWLFIWFNTVLLVADCCLICLFCCLGVAVVVYWRFVCGLLFYIWFWVWVCSLVACLLWLVGLLILVWC